MATSNRLGDIPGARFHVPSVAPNASVASNGANAKIGQIGPFSDITLGVRRAFWTPTGADSDASATATYRRLTIRNGGPSGTATAIVASLNLTATHASLAPVAMTVDTSATVASTDVLVFSQETVGGTDANGTVLRAGQFAFDYEIL